MNEYQYVMNIIPLNLQKAVGLSRLSNKSMELQKSADRSINEIKMTISVLFVEVKISNTNIGPFPDLLSELLPTKFGKSCHINYY